MMNRKTTHSIRLGLFNTVGVATIIIAIDYIGIKMNLIAKTFMLSRIVNDPSELPMGNNVHDSELNVGMVTDITLTNNTLILVAASIEKHVHQVIRKNYALAIGSAGVMGKRVMSITPRAPHCITINDSDIFSILETLRFEAILSKLKKSSHNATQGTKKLVPRSHKIKQGEGVFGKLIAYSLLRNNFARISIHATNITHDFSHISDKLTQKEALFEKLLPDISVGMRLETISRNVTSPATNLRKIMQHFEQEERVFGKILINTTSSANLDQMFTHRQYTLQQSGKVADRLERISTTEVKGRGG